MAVLVSLRIKHLRSLHSVIVALSESDAGLSVVDAPKDCKYHDAIVPDADRSHTGKALATVGAREDEPSSENAASEHRRTGGLERLRQIAARSLFGDEPFENLVVLLLAVLAVWSVCAQIGFLVGLRIGQLFHLTDLALVLLLPPLLFAATRARWWPRAEERTVAWGLTLLSVVGGLLALLAIRPDPDDETYLGRVVYFLDNPEHPLDFVVRHISFADYDPGVRYLFHTIEFFWAYVGRLIDLPVLGAYHGIAPLLGGALIPVAWFLLLRRFTSFPGSAFLGAVAICCLLALDGGAHASFGNTAFVRIWQGKIWAMSLALPLFAAFSIDLLRGVAPRRSWTRLFLCVTGASCMSSTCGLLAIFAVCLLAAGACAGWIRGLAGLRRAALYASSFAGWSIPVLWLLWDIVTRNHRTGPWVAGLGEESALAGLPQWYAESLRYVWGEFPWVAGLALLAVALLLRHAFRDRTRRSARFVLAWFAAAMAIYLSRQGCSGG
jgi:hypothetical protein